MFKTGYELVKVSVGKYWVKGVKGTNCHLAVNLENYTNYSKQNLWKVKVIKAIAIFILIIINCDHGFT